MPLHGLSIFKKNQTLDMIINLQKFINQKYNQSQTERIQLWNFQIKSIWLVGRVVNRKE